MDKPTDRQTDRQNYRLTDRQKITKRIDKIAMFK